MRTIEDIKAKCRIEPGDKEGQEHWIWEGALNKTGHPACYAPSYTKDPTGNTMTVQNVGRALAHIQKRAPLRKGIQYISTCAEKRCVSPDCVKGMTRKAWGRLVRETGREAGQVKWTLSNLKSWDKRGRKITPAAAKRILSSDKDPKALAVELDVDTSTVRKVLRGRAHVQTSVGMFAGLMR